MGGVIQLRFFSEIGTFMGFHFESVISLRYFVRFHSVGCYWFWLR